MEIAFNAPAARNVWQVYASGYSGDADAGNKELIYQGPSAEIAQRTYLEISALSNTSFQAYGGEFYSSLIWPLLEGDWDLASDFSTAPRDTPFAWAAIGWSRDATSDDGIDATLTDGSLFWIDEHGAPHEARVIFSPEEQRAIDAFKGASAKDAHRLAAAWEALALSHIPLAKASSTRPGI